MHGVFSRCGVLYRKDPSVYTHNRIRVRQLDAVPLFIVTVLCGISRETGGAVARKGFIQRRARPFSSYPSVMVWLRSGVAFTLDVYCTYEIVQ